MSYLRLTIIDIFEMRFHMPSVYMKQKMGVHMSLLKIKIELPKTNIIVKLKCLQVMWEACLKYYKIK